MTRELYLSELRRRLSTAAKLIEHEVGRRGGNETVMPEEKRRVEIRVRRTYLRRLLQEIDNLLSPEGDESSQTSDWQTVFLSHNMSNAIHEASVFRAFSLACKSFRFLPDNGQQYNLIEVIPQVKAKIRNCVAVIGVLTPQDDVMSPRPWLIRELGYSDALNKPYFPITADPRLEEFVAMHCPGRYIEQQPNFLRLGDGGMQMVFERVLQRVRDHIEGA